MTETELIRRAVEGDTTAWEPLVRLHQDAVYRLGYLMTGDPDEAEDVAQEAEEFFEGVVDAGAEKAEEVKKSAKGKAKAVKEEVAEAAEELADEVAKAAEEINQ